jgi:hypothetical protein
MKDWDEIVRTYEKDNVFLGELAQLLSSAVNFEMYIFLHRQ